MIDEKKIDAIKNKIVNTVSPETIILFGSYAKGEPTEESDLDIVVIWDSDFNPHKRNLFLSRLFPGRDFSLDIFAFTKGEAEKLKNVKGTILYEAFHYGKVIYGVEVRYPDIFYEPTLDETQNAYKIAIKIKNIISARVNI